MSGVLRTVGMIASVVAVAAGPLGAPVWVARVAAAVAVGASIGAQLTARKPSAVGTSTDVTIGANLPSPMILGESYYGGTRVHAVGYGSQNDVPNAYLWAVDVFSVGGPVEALLGRYADFTALSFSGGKEVGYYSNDTMFGATQLGAVNEASALTPHWSGAPDWGTAYKLSGKAAIGWNARFPKDGKRYGAGFPQTGAVWRGVKAYDPRQDSSYPGGSGAQRWSSPTDRSAFDSARASWSYTRNPGLHALKYALGTWERDMADSGSTYRKVFGVGGSIDQIVVEDFVELANVCDLNGWTVNGVILEGAGQSKWDNLKRILQAGGAEPVFKGARLGLKINAPRVTLDTIDLDDIGDGEPMVEGTTGYAARKNTLTPYYISPAHKWESTPSAPVQVTEYVTMDGEEKAEDLPFDLVTNANQAAQLTGYALVNLREQAFTLPVLPRLRNLPAGGLVALSTALRERYGIRTATAEIRKRGRDLSEMRWNLSLVTETAGKHDFALALTGTSPPAPTILSPEEIDNAVAGDPGAISTVIRQAYLRVTGDLLTATETGGVATIAVAAQAWDYPDRSEDVARDAGSVGGLALSTTYFVYFDDSSTEATSVTYAVATTQAEALNSSAHPFRHYLGSVTTPASGGGSSSGGGGGGGYCPTPDMWLQTRDRGRVKACDLIAQRDHVWGRDEMSGVWGWYRVTAVRPMRARVFEAEIDGETYRASIDHPWWIDGGWRQHGTLPQAREKGLGTVIAITVAQAHTYLLLAREAAERGVLSHNKQVNDYL